MKVIQAPAGDFYIATHEKIAVFDRSRENAVRRLCCLIWPMPAPKYFTEDVSAVRTRPARDSRHG